jgi:TRAP-type uncharacterized transport system substrate-binding protein
MSCSNIIAGTIFVTLVVGIIAPPAEGAATRSPASSADSAAINRGVVELETGSSAGISVRIAEDLANVVNDGATRRVVPVVGKGSLGNLADLKLLRGIDIAILQTDILDYAREQQLFPGIETSLTYIAKLYNEEFHLLARPQINSIADLANRKVNVDLRDSSTAITAGRIFDLLKLPVILTNDPPEIALEKLRNGELAALAVVAGKPAPFFRDIRGDDGLHLLAVPLQQTMAAGYLPARLTPADYPGLVVQNRTVDTVGVGTVLVAANLQQAPERYRNVANFVEAFFAGFQSLLEPGHHPKWREVNLAAELAGWHRYPPAEQWLQRNQQVVKASNPQDVMNMFARFVDERRQSIGGAPMTPQEKSDLFKQYQGWETGQLR